jgi:hypothetical protein
MRQPFSLAQLMLVGAMLASAANSAPQRGTVKIVALVGQKSVSDRDVLVDWCLEAPKNFRGKDFDPKKLPERGTKEFEESLQRVIARIMIVQESLILGGERIRDEQVASTLAAARLAMGAQAFSGFLKVFDLSDPELRSLVFDRLTVSAALGARLKSAQELGQNQDLSKVLDDWLRQLRSRYRIQFYKRDNDAQIESKRSS